MLFTHDGIEIIDISTNKETRIAASTSASNLRIFGNNTFWVESHEMTEPGWGPEPDILMYDVSTSLNTIVRSGIGGFEIYGNRIIWSNNSYIYMYDLSTKKDT
jgi:beta propeller repeat protein